MQNDELHEVTNQTLLRDKKRWRIKQIDEQKCTQKIGILPGPTKKWRIDELNDDELDEFYCVFDKCYHNKILSQTDRFERLNYDQLLYKSFLRSCFFQYRDRNSYRRRRDLRHSRRRSRHVPRLPSVGKVSPDFSRRTFFSGWEVRA